MRTLILFVVVILIVIVFVAIMYGLDTITGPLSIFARELTK